MSDCSALLKADLPGSRATRMISSLFPRQEMDLLRPQINLIPAVVFFSPPVLSIARCGALDWHWGISIIGTRHARLSNSTITIVVHEIQHHIVPSTRRRLRVLEILTSYDSSHYRIAFGGTNC